MFLKTKIYNWLLNSTDAGGKTGTWFLDVSVSVEVLDDDQV